jgi:hypothetical protein
MWLLIAVVCLGMESTSCKAIYYAPQSFLTEEQCNTAMAIEEPKIGQTFMLSKLRCIEIPGQVNS